MVGLLVVRSRKTRWVGLCRAALSNEQRASGNRCRCSDVSSKKMESEKEMIGILHITHLGLDLLLGKFSLDF